MGPAEITMEARLEAIMVSLNESRMLLASSAQRLEVKERQGQVATTSSSATRTTPMFMQDPVREKPETKPSSPSLISTRRVGVVGVLHADPIRAPAMPARCSTLRPAGNFGNNHPAAAIPTSGTTHLPTTTSTGAEYDKVPGLAGTGVNSQADWSTKFFTNSPVEPAARAHYVDTDMPRGLPFQVKEHPAYRPSLLPQISFPRFNGDNPRLWRARCLEFFKTFSIPQCTWVTAATLHMEGIAAEWYHAYRLRQPVGDWSQFMNAVELNFDDGDLKTHDTSEQQLMWCEASFGDDTHMVEPFIEDSDGVQTNVGDLSVCSELDIHSADEVLTHVGGFSLFLERDLEYAGEVFNDIPVKDVVWDEELADIVTHIGGSSLFLEHVMGTNEENKGTYLDSAVCLVGLVSLMEVKQPQPFSRERRQHGMNCPTLLLPWDRGKQGKRKALIHHLCWPLPHARNGTVPILPWDPMMIGNVHVVLDQIPPWDRNAFSPGDGAAASVHFQFDKIRSWSQSCYSPRVVGRSNELSCSNSAIKIASTRENARRQNLVANGCLLRRLWGSCVSGCARWVQNCVHWGQGVMKILLVYAMSSIGNLPATRMCVCTSWFGCYVVRLHSHLIYAQLWQSSQLLDQAAGNPFNQGCVFDEVPHSRSAIISIRSATQDYYFSLEYIPPWHRRFFSPGPRPLVQFHEQQFARGDLQVTNQLAALIHQWYSLLIQLKGLAFQYLIQFVHTSCKLLIVLYVAHGNQNMVVLGCLSSPSMAVPEEANQFQIEVVSSCKAYNLTTVQTSERYGRGSYANRHCTWMLRGDGDDRMSSVNKDRQMPWDPGGVCHSGLRASRSLRGRECHVRCHVHLLKIWAWSRWALGCVPWAWRLEVMDDIGEAAVHGRG